MKNATFGPAEGFVLFFIWWNRPCGSKKWERAQWKGV